MSTVTKYRAVRDSYGFQSRYWKAGETVTLDSSVQVPEHFEAIDEPVDAAGGGVGASSGSTTTNSSQLQAGEIQEPVEAVPGTPAEVLAEAETHPVIAPDTVPERTTAKTRQAS